MKKLKVFLSVLVMLSVSGGVVWAALQTINTDNTQDQTITGGTNINISNSGGGAHRISFVSSFTSGSVIFSQGASLSQDNSNLFWNDASNRFGVGTNTPSSTVDVNGTVEATQVSTNTIVASGSNQSLSLNPTGTGKVLVGGESLVVARLTSQPASASTGQIYFDRTLGIFRGYTGTSWVSFVPSAYVGLLVVGGGGNGGDTLGDPQAAGGGGAGEFKYNAAVAVGPLAYSVVVGNSGEPVGETSSALGFSAAGGAAGGNFNQAGGNGASGGGGGGPGKTGGTGTAGNNGGAGADGGGGGGGSGAVGANASVANGGNGGAGTASSISGTSVLYAGGGGGGADSGGTPGTGAAGGGNGGNSGGVGSAATANTGSGGGGSADGTGGGGGVGGSGIVIISYPTGLLTATGGTITTSGGNTIHTFTSSGTFTVTSI